MQYYLWIIYEDGTTYQSRIRSQKDIDKIPKSKGYEAIKIVYADPKYRDYSHMMYGKDNVFLRYYDNALHYSQFDNGGEEKFAKVIVLNGVGKEEIFEDQKDLPKTFIGKLIEPESEYLKMRLRCEQWQPR